MAVIPRSTRAQCCQGRSECLTILPLYSVPVLKPHLTDNNALKARNAAPPLQLKARQRGSKVNVQGAADGHQARDLGKHAVGALLLHVRA